MVQHKSSVELAGLIRKESFRPVPRVDSAVVVMRRKKAKKVLRQYLETLGRGKAAIQTVSPLPDARVFQLKVSDFERLSNEISEMRRERVE